MRRIGISLVVLAFLAAQLVVVLSVPRQVSAYTPHAPIFINGNSGFNASNGVTGGSGTPSDPFMIEGWEINASTADGIRIQNTDAYFVIRSVFIHYGFSNYNGVTFSYVSNGQVDSSTISENRYGLYLTSTYSIAVLKSTITNNDCGIEATIDTQNTTISDSYVSGNNGIGALIGSSSVTVENNVFTSNGYEGLFLKGANYGTVKNNQVFNNSNAGIQAWGVYGMDIVGNAISGNSWGISLNMSTQALTIAQNEIWMNLYDGIRMMAPAYNMTIAYNNISWNYGYGVLLQGATGISVHHNNFIGNQYQANDSVGTANNWDNGCNSGGNYWSDHSDADNRDCRTGGTGSDGFGDTPYVIDFDSEDSYPLMTPWSGNITNNSAPNAPYPICLQGLCSDSIDARLYHITQLTNFPITWVHSDPDGDPQTQATMQINESFDGSGPMIWTRTVSTGPPVTFNANLLKCTNYRLEIHTRDARQWGRWAFLPFHTNCRPIGLSNLAPPNGAMIFPSPNQRLWWTTAIDIDPTDSVNYTWEVSTDLGFLNLVSAGTTANNFSNPFATMCGTTYYWHVNASDGWESIPFTSPWAFTAVCPGPPSLGLNRPVGGEYWRGASTEQILWNVSDFETPQKNITIWVNYTSSVSSGPIVGPIRIVTSYLWTVPMIDAVDVRVNITAIDGDGMQSWDESANFTIDSTPPMISSYTPTGWNVPLDALVQVGFSEPVDAVSGQMRDAFGLLNEDTSLWVAVDYVRIPSTWPQEVRVVPKQPLPPCNTYRALVNVTFVVDRASWSLSTPGNWTFDTVCAPTATFLTSLTGKDWSGGSKHNFSWTMGDEIDTQLRVWLNYSVNGGADNYPFSFYTGMNSTGTNTYTWTLPLVDSTNARVRVTVIDSSGLRATADSAVFMIDSTRPSILSSVPNEGAPGVTITDDIQVVFSEAVVRSTAESGFSISPNPTGITFGWQNLPSGKDMLVIGHKPLKSKTDYIVSFSTNLRDVSDPGNSPSAALTIHFSTKPPPPGIPPIAKAVGKNQVEVGEPVTLDGSGSTGSISMYIWTITDNQNRIVDVLAGKTVTFTFRDNGRYKVTLTVVDGSTGLFGHDSIEIVVTSGSNAGTLILLSSAIIVGAAIGGTEAGRVALFMLLAVPVYRRKMKGKEDSETRGMVKGYILVHPGDTYTEIKQNLRLQNGSLTWHLMKLEKEGVVKSKVQGTRRKYYPSSMPLPLEDGGELHEIEKQMLRIVKSDPGMTVKILAEELGVSSQLALYHLRKLSQKGLLNLERRGLRLKVFVPPKQDA